MSLELKRGEALVWGGLNRKNTVNRITLHRGPTEPVLLSNHDYRILSRKMTEKKKKIMIGDLPVFFWTITAEKEIIIATIAMCRTVKVTLTSCPR